MKKQKTDYKKIALDGILYNNPVFVQLLGMCSTLAITTTVFNGIGMGLCVTFVLMFSNLFVSVLRKFIPEKVRIAAYVVIIAGFVTVIDLVMQAYLPSLSASLGVFIPLIVVNCIILARAESFASKNKPLPSVADGFFSGMGFMLAQLCMCVIREMLGNGTFFGNEVMPSWFSPSTLIVSPSGGFLVLGGLIALVQFIMSKKKKKGENK